MASAKSDFSNLLDFQEGMNKYEDMNDSMVFEYTIKRTATRKFSFKMKKQHVDKAVHYENKDLIWRGTDLAYQMNR